MTAATDKGRYDGPLADLTPGELEMLGHSLRMVPHNACLTGNSAARMGKPGVGFFHEIESFKSLWEKVAQAVRERDDMAPARGGHDDH